MDDATGRKRAGLGIEISRELVENALNTQDINSSAKETARNRGRYPDLTV